jgi:hypothetical protein
VCRFELLKPFQKRAVSNKATYRTLGGFEYAGLPGVRGTRRMIRISSLSSLGSDQFHGIDPLILPAAIAERTSR